MHNSIQLALPILLWGSLAQAQTTSPPQPGNVLMVGPGMTFALPSEAARAARSGDTIRITSGTYSDCARWNADDLIIEGLGDGATITDKVCDDKGLFITRGRNITVRNITFLAAHATSHNGSGIRAEGAVLLVENSRFIDNEDGPTAVEYAVMLALIIVLCIVVIRQVGTSASKTFSIADSALQ